MRTRPTQLAIAAACFAGCALLTPAAAFAQQGIPCSIVDSPSPTRADLQRIEAFAVEHASALASGPVDGVEDARKQLLRPFYRCSSQSITFRLNFGRAIASELESAVVGEDIHRAINALIVLGPVGIAETTDLVLEGMKDTRPAVRLAAAAGLEAAIKNDLSNQQVRTQAERALREAAQALPAEQDPAVAAALVGALAVPQSQQDMLTLSADELSTALPQMLAALPENADALVWAKTISLAAATIRQASNFAQSANDTAAIRRHAVAMASVVGFVETTLAEIEDLGSADETAMGVILTEVVATAGGQLEMAARTLAGQNVVTRDLTSSLERAMESGDAGEFSRDVDAWRALGEQMSLGADPFGG